MPVSIATPVLANGLLPMFIPATAPETTAKAADAWAKAYVGYAVAGGVVAANTRRLSLAQALTAAFRPELAGGGQALFMAALAAFWIGMPIPAQLGAAVVFAPTNPSVNSPQDPSATPQQQANGLARVIAGLTLGAVKVQLATPPNPIVPLV